jgi:hypothetical protein
VAFVPTASGMASGSLTLTTAINQVLVVSLQGLSAAPAPVLAWQTGGVTALQFDSTEVGKTSAAKSVTLQNQGPGAVSFTALEADGMDKAQFSVASASTCRVGTSLAQGASCQLVVAFAPAAAGSRSATLRIASNATAPATMSLSGVATSASTGAGLLWMDFTSLGFMAGTGKASGAQVLTVKNQGSGALTLSGIGTTGPFQIVNSDAGGCSVPQQLAAGASCVLSVVFNAPQAAGDSTGTVALESAGGESRSVGLSGRAIVTNAGGSGDTGDGKGGGGANPWALVALALAAAALAPRRRRGISNA